jgi:hypothetical protein
LLERRGCAFVVTVASCTSVAMQFFTVQFHYPTPWPHVQTPSRRETAKGSCAGTAVRRVRSRCATTALRCIIATRCARKTAGSDGTTRGSARSCRPSRRRRLWRSTVLTLHWPPGVEEGVGRPRQVVREEEGQHHHHHLSPQQKRRARMPTQSTLA